jgi:pimeloyl-ACP methyl ester carboxylesterase
VQPEDVTLASDIADLEEVRQYFKLDSVVLLGTRGALCLPSNTRFGTRSGCLSPGYDLLPKLKSLRIPTLVVYGDHEFIPAATAVHITQAMPHAHMVTLKDCGHFSYLECPAAVRNILPHFFVAR